MLNIVINKIEKHFDNKEKDNYEPLKDILLNLSNTELKILLNEFIESKSVFFTSQKSYKHKNGFEKFIIYQSKKNNWRLRLHFWQKQPEITFKTDLHTHSWDFISKIIVGEIENEIYEYSSNGTQFYHYQHEIDNANLTSTFHYLGTKMLTKTSDSKILYENMLYIQKGNLIHNIIPDNTKDNLTLVIQLSNIHGRVSDVYRKKKNETEDNNIFNTSMREVDVILKLKKIISII